MDDPTLAGAPGAFDGSPLGLERAARFLTLLSEEVTERHLMERLAGGPAAGRAGSAGKRSGAAARRGPAPTPLEIVLGRTWALLDSGERACVAACSVFPEEFSVRDAERVWRPEAGGCLASLAARGLLERAGLAEGELRYAMLAPVRAWARLRLEQSGKAEAALSACAGLEAEARRGEARSANAADAASAFGRGAATVATAAAFASTQFHRLLTGGETDPAAALRILEALGRAPLSTADALSGLELPGESAGAGEASGN